MATILFVFAEISVVYHKELKFIECDGIKLFETILTKSPQRQNVQSGPLLETMEFTFYENNWDPRVSLEKSLTVALGIILQNSNGVIMQLSVCEISTDNSSSTLVNLANEILSKKPFTISNFIKTDVSNISGKYDVILLDETVLFDELLLTDNLNEDGFVIYIGPGTWIKKCALNTIFSTYVENNMLFLLRKCSNNLKKHVIMDFRNKDFHWIDDLKGYIRNTSSKTVYLVSREEDLTGTMGLINCLNKESTSCKFRAIFTDEEFSLDNKLYKEQFDKDLVFNILKDGNWGTYVHFPLKSVEKEHVPDAAVEIATVGNLSSLTWTQIPSTYHL